jgi:hypothetical protein
MAKSMHIEEADNGYMCTGSEDGEYPGKKMIAGDIDEVHEHVKKHFSGKSKSKKTEKKPALGNLAKH